MGIINVRLEGAQGIVKIFYSNEFNLIQGSEKLFLSNKDLKDEYDFYFPCHLHFPLQWVKYSCLFCKWGS